MLHLFLPNRYVQSIFDIKGEELKGAGIRGMVVDLDNTLVPWNVADAPEKVEQWLRTIVRSGIKIVIFSNNNEDRVRNFAEPLQIPYIYRAQKPLQHSFKKVAHMMGISSGQLAVVGDQLLTDMLGGNVFGAYTILVQPIVQSDAIVTKFNRQVEKLVLHYFYRTGKLLRPAVICQEENN